MESIYLTIVLAPLAAAIISGLFGKSIGRVGAHSVTILGVAISCALSCYVLYEMEFSGLETYNGKAKPAYNGFRLPLVVTRTSTGVTFWGLVRPLGAPAAPKPPTGSTGPTGATGATHSNGRTVVLEYSSDGGHSWHTLSRLQASSSGAWSASGRFAADRLWRVEWASSSGQTFTGAATRAYTSSGKIES